MATTDNSEWSQWKFTSTGSAYYIDNIGAKNAGLECRLNGTSDNETIRLAQDSWAGDYFKWTLTGTGDYYLPDNVGAKADGYEPRMNAAQDNETVRLVPNSWSGVYSQWV